MKSHRVTLTNRDDQVLVVPEDQTIYQAALKVGIQLPIACAYGGCITCAARKSSGKVVQPKGTALNKRQSKAGYILLCVARPRSDVVLEVGVESHSDLYENPFAAPSPLPGLKR
ncbi:MAG: 2Fe-2S iron-sulfur cluster-binding protein [Pseudomonadota bacterium]